MNKKLEFFELIDSIIGYGRGYKSMLDEKSTTIKSIHERNKEKDQRRLIFTWSISILFVVLSIACTVSCYNHYDLYHTSMGRWCITIPMLLISIFLIIVLNKVINWDDGQNTIVWFVLGVVFVIVDYNLYMHYIRDEISLVLLVIVSAITFVLLTFLIVILFKKKIDKIFAYKVITNDDYRDELWENRSIYVPLIIEEALQKNVSIRSNAETELNSIKLQIGRHNVKYDELTKEFNDLKEYYGSFSKEKLKKELGDGYYQVCETKELEKWNDLSTKILENENNKLQRIKEMKSQEEFNLEKQKKNLKELEEQEKQYKVYKHTCRLKKIKKDVSVFAGIFFTSSKKRLDIICNNGYYVYENKIINKNYKKTRLGNKFF